MVPLGTEATVRRGVRPSLGTLSRARSRLGSNQTTVAGRAPPPAWVMTRCSLVPATTWALVTTRAEAIGKPLPNSRPPQPRLSICTVASRARLTPAVLTAAGAGPELVGGCRLANESGNG